VFGHRSYPDRRGFPKGAGRRSYWTGVRLRDMPAVAGLQSQVIYTAHYGGGRMQPFAIAWNPEGYLNNSMHRIAVRAV